jgi:GNAT superfamily N-acetyltransferase
MMNELQFIKFASEYKSDFVRLNYDWLNEYFEIEPYDCEVLESCEQTIIAKGGHIFFALLDHKVVGTFAYIKIEEGVYELSKMAVTKSLRSRGIGNQIIAFSIRFAEQHHWKKLILYSSRKLKNSIHLYRKYGYIEVPLENNAPYKRGDIKMELDLKV